MTRIRELDLQHSALIDELRKLVKMGRTNYKNDPELYALCSKIDNICGLLSQHGEFGYKGGFEYVEQRKNAIDVADFGPTGITNPANYMSKVTFEKDTDGDGDIDTKVTRVTGNEEDL